MIQAGIIIAVAGLLTLQIICAGPILNRILARVLRPYFFLDWRGIGLVLPLLYFSARRVRFMIQGGPDRDRVYFEARSLRCRIDPIFLLLGRVRVVGLRLEEPLLHYFNRQASYQKNRLLPRRHRIELKNLSIKDGFLLILDETMAPAYRLTLRDVVLENADMDAGTPIDVLFRAEKGQARIDSGHLEIGRHGHEGTIRLWGVTWAEIAGLGDMPFMSRRMALYATHTGGSHGRKAQGLIGTTPAGKPVKEFFSLSEVSTRISFDFAINWEDYALTFDLGIQKLIGEILGSANASGFSRGVLPGLRTVFELLKKQERESP